MSNDVLRVATVQAAPVLADVAGNLRRIERWAQEAAKRDAHLVVLPEAFLQGIVYEDHASALEAAVAENSPELERIANLAVSLGLGIVVGFLERHGDAYSNSAVTALPDGRRYIYRKTHLTELGADRWAVAGSEIGGPFEYHGVQLGVLICYDVRFPEVSRVLALQGAEALLLPTNSPVGYEGTYDHAARTRAWENRVWFLAANRIGTERDAVFIGRSLAVDPLGNTVHQLQGDEEAMLLTDVEPSVARDKGLPGHGESVYSFVSARRPDLYEPLSTPSGSADAP